MANESRRQDVTDTTAGGVTESGFTQDPPRSARRLRRRREPSRGRTRAAVTMMNSVLVGVGGVYTVTLSVTVTIVAAFVAGLVAAVVWYR